MDKSLLKFVKLLSKHVFKSVFIFKRLSNTNNNFYKNKIMRLNKTEREVLRKKVEIVIPQISKLEIFNQKVFNEELSTIS